MPTQDLVFQFFGVDRTAGAQFSALGGKAEKAGASLKAFAGVAGVAAVAVAVESVKMAAAWQSSTELIHTQAGASQSDVNAMRKSMLSLAGPTATAPDQLAEAMFHIVSASHGLTSVSQQLDELKIAAEGAKVGHADLVDVTNALNATIVSGIGGVRSYSQAMGALNAIVGAGDMHMQDLAEALGTGVLAVVKQYNVTLPQVGAALAVFGDNNIRGAQAATYLRMAVQALTVPAKQGKDALAQLGLTGKDAFTHFGADLTKGGLTKALDDLNTRLMRAKANGQSTGQILTDAFGKRAGVGLSVLIGQFGRYETKLDEVKQGQQTFGSAWTATTHNLDFQWQRLAADVDVMAIKIGTALIPVAMDAIHGIEGMGNASASTVRFFQEHEVATAALAAVLATALLPALTRTAVAFGANAFEGAAAGIYKLTYAASGAVGALKAMTVAEVATTTVGTLGLAAAVAALTYSWQKDRAENAAARKGVDDYVQSLHISVNSVSSLAAGINTLKTSQIGMTAQALKARGGMLAQLSGVKEYGSQLATLQGQQRTVSVATRDMGREFGLSASQVVTIANALGPNELSGDLKTVESDFAAYIKQAQQSRNPSEAAAAAFSDINGAATNADQALQDLTTAFDNLLGNFLNVKQAQLAFKNDLVTLTKDLHKSHDSLTMNTAAGRESRGAYLSLAQQIESTAQKVLKQTGSTDAARRATATMRSELAKLPATGSLVRSTLGDIRAVMHGLAGSAGGLGTATGTDYGTGLVHGLNDSVPAVGRAAANLAGEVDKVARGAMIAKSPSRKAIKTGQDYGSGLVIGLKSKTHAVYLSGHEMATLLFEGLHAGWTGEAGRLKNVLGTSIENSLNHVTSIINSAMGKQQAVVKAANQQLHQDLQSRASDIANLAGSVQSGSALSNLFGTDANGNPTMGLAGQFLAGQVGPEKKFAQDMARLGALQRKMHGSQARAATELLAQVAQMGPVQGDALAMQFLSGQSSFGQAATSQSLIDRYSHAAAATVGNEQWRKALDKDRTELHDARKNLHDLRMSVDKLERRIAHGIAAHVTVVDAKGTLKLKAKDGREIRRITRKNLKRLNLKP